MHLTFFINIFHKNLTNGIYMAIIQSIDIRGAVKMIIRTKIFEMCNGRYRNLTELAQAMELSVSQVYRVREGKRGINEKFIVGAKRAFSDCKLDDLFFLDYAPKYDTIARKIDKRQYYNTSNQ